MVFRGALAEALPFPDAHFDVVLCTVMLHHLPRKARQQCATEIRRVLKLGGRVLAVDFGSRSHARRSLIGHFHRHGHTKVEDIIALLTTVGLQIIDSGEVGTNDLQFVLAGVHEKQVNVVKVEGRLEQRQEFGQTLSRTSANPRER